MNNNFDLQEELQSLQDVENYTFANEHNISNEAAEGLLEGAVESLAETSDSITDPEVFDVYRSLLKHSGAVPGAVMHKLLDSITSGLQAEVEATFRDIETGDQDTYMSHKIPLEMYAFLLQWFVSAVEKVKAPAEGEEGAAPPPPKPRRGRGGKAAATGKRTASKKTSEVWTWTDQVPAVLALICRVLRISTQRLWTTTERDTFIKCITRPAYHVAENEQFMKSHEIRMTVIKVICLAVKHHQHAFAAQINIMQGLQYYEHLSEFYASCLDTLSKEFDHTQLGDEILREIAGKSFGGQDNKGPKSFSKFLIHFSEVQPRQMLKQLSLLMGQLDSEAYPMRLAIVEVVGALIRDIASAETENEEQSQSKKQIGGLYDILLERMLDVSSYVRIKVLSVFAKLCHMGPGHKFPKQRLAMARAAVAALEDKVASVRKGAIVLLVELLKTHPWFATQGGLLERNVFVTKYKEVSAQLEKMEGKFGKAVERNENGGEETDVDEPEDDDDDGDEDEDEDEDEDDDNEEGSSRKKSKKSREDDMDVDGEDQGEMDFDGHEGQPRKKTKKSKKKTKLRPRKSQLDVTAVIGEQEALAALEGSEAWQLRLTKKYLIEALHFIAHIESAMKIIMQLLGSTSKAEVLEAMEFFREAHVYKFPEAQDGLQKMLHLIWTKDNTAMGEDGKELKGVRSRLLECYSAIYFEPIAGLEPKAQVNRIAKNMVELTYESTLADLTSLEEMMRIMMENKQVHHDIIAKLWNIYSSSRPLPKPQRRGAIIILGMLALATRKVLTDHVDTMLKIGMGSYGKHDLMLARYTCVALHRLNGSAKKVKGSLIDNTIRLEIDNPIFQKLQDMIELPTRSRNWFGLAEQAINTIYALAEHPDQLCNEIIKKLTIKVFTPRKRTKQTESAAEKDPDAMDEDQDGDTSRMSDATVMPEDDAGQDLGDAFELSQLLFVVGHVAIKHIVYLELVEREWKRQKAEREGAEKAAARAGSSAPSTKDGEELDQVVGNAEDEIGDRMSGIRETELLYGEGSLLAMYGPMLVQICGSPQKYKNPTLRAAAILSFSKFLCVSSQFCDKHHKLLFRLLEKVKTASIRSNIVIALGDVAVSFSSIIDENSDELYKGLSDSDIIVKKNTLMVLTHLILNGMIKVKGQLGEMAKCLEDEDARISDLAKLFFKELSTKDNAIYNNLPDIISHLSIGEHAVDEDTFEKTMRYIFSFIEKEKQAENIVEKLCQRFRLTEEPRQWRDIAFCLSLLPFKSDRSVKKLIEGLPFYRDKLHEDKVYDKFVEILVKARQNKSPNKPDTELDEFEQILDEHKRHGKEDHALEKRVKGKKNAAAKKRGTKKNAPRKKATPKLEAEEEEEE